MSVLSEAILNLTFNGREIMALGETFVDDAFVLPGITEIHSIREGIKDKEQIGFLENLYKISRLDAGCGDNFQDKSTEAREKFWEPVGIEVAVKQCYTDLEKTFFQWGTANGIARANLTQGDALTFIMSSLAIGVADDTQRIAWFANPDHTNVGAGSGTELITAGVDIEDYIQYPGFWEQIFDIVAGNGAQLTDIDENQQATKALQDSVWKDDTDNALDLFTEMAEAADTRLFNHSPVFIVTRSILNQYKRFLRGKETDASFVKVENGQAQYSFDGIPIVEYQLWDRTIRADFDDTTIYDLPHRAVLTTKENLAIGFDSAKAGSDFEVEYLSRFKEVTIRSLYQGDAKVLRDYLIQAAY